MKSLSLMWLLFVLATNTAAGATIYTPLDAGITLQSGDNWIDRGVRYRLYGVQSCLRGTLFTDRTGGKRDCGEASMAVLAAFIKDTRPQCAPVAVMDGTRFVLCYGTVASQKLDLATALVTAGFAFAATGPDGLPIHPPYAVAEQQAKERKVGLWQFHDVPHPVILLGRTAKNREAR